MQSLLKTKLNVTLPEMELPESLQQLTLFGGNKTDRVGVQLRKKGLRPKHPVVIVPGACFHRSRSKRRPLVPCKGVPTCCVPHRVHLHDVPTPFTS